MKPNLDQGPDYERGFVDGMLYQTQTSVDKAVNAMAQPEHEQALLDAIVGGTGVMLGDKRIDPASIYKQRPWVGLTDEEIEDCMEMSIQKTCRAVGAKLKEKNT